MTAAPDRRARKALRQVVNCASTARVPVSLIGSYARGTATVGESDIDVLALGALSMNEIPDNVHVVRLTIDELAARVADGDDFAQWALRFGIPLTNRTEWAALADQLLPTAPWPSPARKLVQVERRLGVAEELLAMGDADAATQETYATLNLLARALLLAKQVFPMTAPELPDQLRSIELRALADAMDDLRFAPTCDRTTLRGVVGLAHRSYEDLRAAVAIDVRR